jgi:hypothetical protein
MSQLQAPMTCCWVNLFVFRRVDANIRMESVPQEGQLLQVPEAFLHSRVQNLKEYVQRCTTGLVCNLGDLDISQWQDRKTGSMAVPATIRHQTIVHGISRNIKHISVIAYVSTPEKSFIPYIITLSDFVLIREQLKKQVVGVEMEWIWS